MTAKTAIPIKILVSATIRMEVVRSKILSTITPQSTTSRKQLLPSIIGVRFLGEISNLRDPRYGILHLKSNEYLSGAVSHPKSVLSGSGDSGYILSLPILLGYLGYA